MEQARRVIFDCRGTLLPVRTNRTRLEHRSCNLRGHIFDPEEGRASLRRNAQAIFEYLLGRGIGPVEVRRLIGLKEQIFRPLCRKDEAVPPGRRRTNCSLTSPRAGFPQRSQRLRDVRSSVIREAARARPTVRPERIVVTRRSRADGPGLYLRAARRIGGAPLAARREKMPVQASNPRSGGSDASPPSLAEEREFMLSIPGVQDAIAGFEDFSASVRNFRVYSTPRVCAPEIDRSVAPKKRHLSAGGPYTKALSVSKTTFRYKTEKAGNLPVACFPWGLSPLNY